MWLITLKYRLVISYKAEGAIYHVARHVQTISGGPPQTQRKDN